jgi:hypothetical protein
VQGTDNLEDVDVDRRIIIKWVFDKKDGRLWTELI